MSWPELWQRGELWPTPAALTCRHTDTEKLIATKHQASLTRTVKLLEGRMKANVHHVKEEEEEENYGGTEKQ